MKKHKRLIIILSSLFGVLVTLIILMFTLFGLNKISIDFQNDTNIFSDLSKKEQIINDANLKKHSCVLFLNKKNYIDKLEKKNPYLKIINIETVFPNNIVLHCAEREELYAIEVSRKKYLICDEDFKVLNISDYSLTNSEDDYDSNMTNALILKGLTIKNTNAKIGEFLEISSYKDIHNNIITAMAVNNRDVSETKSLIKNIDINIDVLDRIKLTIDFHSGYKIEILDADEYLFDKINLMFSIYSKVPANEYQNHKLIIYYDINTKTLTGNHTKII